MAPTCKCEWCVGLPVDGSPYCALHKQVPPLHNFESQKQWRKRYDGLVRAAKKAAEKAAVSDVRIQKRGQ